MFIRALFVYCQSPPLEYVPYEARILHLFRLCYTFNTNCDCRKTKTKKIMGGDEWLVVWVDGWMCGLMDGWTDECVDSWSTHLLTDRRRNSRTLCQVSTLTLGYIPNSFVSFYSYWFYIIALHFELQIFVVTNKVSLCS